MLAQPKSLVVGEGSAPRLEWWPGLDLWITGPDGTRLGETVLCYSGRPAPWTAVTEGHSRTVPVRPIRLPDPGRDDASAVWPGPAALR